MPVVDINFPTEKYFHRTLLISKKAHDSFFPGNFHPITQTEPLSITATLSEMTCAYIRVSTMEFSQQQYFSLSTLDKVFSDSINFMVPAKYMNSAGFYCLLPPTNEVLGKVMFLHLSLCSEERGSAYEGFAYRGSSSGGGGLLFHLRMPVVQHN